MTISILLAVYVDPGHRQILKSKNFFLTIMSVSTFEYTLLHYSRNILIHSYIPFIKVTLEGWQRDTWVGSNMNISALDHHD